MCSTRCLGYRGNDSSHHTSGSAPVRIGRLPIGLDQTISQPLMVAVMTTELELEGIERVLEIGTGSGYQTAVLSLLADEVYTVERLEMLSLRARCVLDGLGLTNIHYRIGDGSLGWPEEAPFDRIIVTAGAPAFPAALFEQLRDGGILVTPQGDASDQELDPVSQAKGPARTSHADGVPVRQADRRRGLERGSGIGPDVGAPLCERIAVSEPEKGLALVRGALYPDLTLWRIVARAPASLRHVRPIVHIVEGGNRRCGSRS